VENEEFFTNMQGSILMRASRGAMGHLEVVVECVVAPKETILNGFITQVDQNPSPYHFSSQKILAQVTW